jgi:hypothetical protein
LNGAVEVAGPERFHFDVLIRQALRARNDRRAVIADAHALELCRQSQQKVA